MCSEVVNSPKLCLISGIRIDSQSEMTVAKTVAVSQGSSTLILKFSKKVLKTGSKLAMTSISYSPTSSRDDEIMLNSRVSESNVMNSGKGSPPTSVAETC